MESRITRDRKQGLAWKEKRKANLDRFNVGAIFIAELSGGEDNTGKKERSQGSCRGRNGCLLGKVTPPTAPTNSQASLRPPPPVSRR